MAVVAALEPEAGACLAAVVEAGVPEVPAQGMASPTMDSPHMVELPSILEPLNLTLG